MNPSAEPPESARARIPELIRQVCEGVSPCACWTLGERPICEPPRLVFPGSFNPIHEGHLRMGRIAHELLGERVEFELSARNVDKPPPSPDALLQRAECLRAATTDDPAFGHLYLTSAPTFVEKARLFPGAMFVVGLDTFQRIGDVQYYGGVAPLTSALEELHTLGTRLLVFYRHLDTLDLWDQLEAYPSDLTQLARFVDRNLYQDEGRHASRRIRAEPSTDSFPRPFDGL